MGRAPEAGGPAHGWGGGRPSGQRRAQAALVDPPEVVAAAVDEGHGDLLGIAAQQLGVVVDRLLGPGHAQLAGHAGDDLAGLLAQVTAGAPEEDHAWRDRAGRLLARHAYHSRLGARPYRPVVRCTTKARRTPGY